MRNAAVHLVQLRAGLDVLSSTGGALYQQQHQGGQNLRPLDELKAGVARVLHRVLSLTLVGRYGLAAVKLDALGQLPAHKDMHDAPIIIPSSTHATCNNMDRLETHAVSQLPACTTCVCITHTCM